MRDDSWKPHANAAMERYAEGDDAALAPLFDLLSPRLHAFLLRRTRDPARAEDVLQDTFLRMHRNRRHFAPGTHVVPWAFAIARNLLIDEHRRDHGTPEVETRDVDPPDVVVARRRLGRRIQDVLSSLPPAHREAFELVQFEGLSMAEAAQMLGTTVTAVKLRAYRAYEALRESLGEEVREELGEPA